MKRILLAEDDNDMRQFLTRAPQNRRLRGGLVRQWQIRL